IWREVPRGHGIPFQEKEMMPLEGLDAKKDLSFDTLENRFVKWMMVRLSEKIADLQQNMQRSSDPQNESSNHRDLLKKLHRKKAALDRRVKSYFWHSMSRLDRSVMSLV